MTKAELIEKIASSAKLNKADTSKALDATIATVKDTLKKGQKIMIVGFGTFSVYRRRARQGRNPRTGEVIKIAATNAPRFTAGKAFKDAIK